MKISWDEAIARGFLNRTRTPVSIPPGVLGVPTTPPSSASKPKALDAPSPDKPERKRKVDREGGEQRVLIELFALEHPEYAQRLIHIPNGGYRSKLERWLMVAQGVRKGVPDLLLPVPRQGFSGLWIEFKAEPPHDAKVTPFQEEWLVFLRLQGYRAELARGCDEAMKILNDYLK